MRKTLLTLILAVFVGWCAGVHAQTIVLSESFEQGLPVGWTQENLIGSTSWTTEVATAAVDLTYPAGAASGIGRAVLRNETGETQGYKTRLITPVMNLDTVFQPILRYFHAQVKWTGDIDTLRVLYRNTEGGEWQLLQEFTQPIQNWKKEELDLPQPSKNYQLCFEGTDNLGRGIVLDSVVVRSKPECTIPHDMSVANFINNGVTLLWQASYDATSYQVVLIKSDEVIDIDTLTDVSKANYVVTDTIITGFSFQCRFENLVPKTKYVAYVRSLCDMENSAWGVFPFYMKAVKNVPYHENFNMALTPGDVDRMKEWSYGNNTGNLPPFINTHQSATDAKQYVMEGTALCFTGNNQVGNGSDIPANLYVYAATPEINVETLQNVQVRFWGSLGPYGSMNTNARSIIVGVMEDAEDVTTFVPVDTMTLWKFATYEEHITTFANYTGAGRVIAFMSQFDKPNQFYIDSMTVEYVPAVAKVMSVNAVPAINEATISWNPVANATAYSVIVATDYTTEVESLGAAKVIDTQVSGNTYKAEGLTEGTQYYVYVKAEGSNEWSNAVEFTTSCKRALPMFFGFEEEEGTYKETNFRPKTSTTNTYPTCLSIYSTDTQFPRLYSSAKRSGKMGMYYQMTMGRDAWVVFPYIDTLIQGVEIEFYMKASSTSYKNTELEIGVMTNPGDLTTFTAVATAQNATTTWKRFYTKFVDYKGEGQYIALRWTLNEAGGATGTYIDDSYPYIDDVRIQPLSFCQTPKMTVDSVSIETATLSWVAPEMDHFQLIIDSLSTRTEEKLKEIVTMTEEELTEAGVYYFFDLKDTTAITLPEGKLKWGHTYYAYIRSVCDTTSYWSDPVPFTLSVPDMLALPFTEGFEGMGTGEGTMAAGWVKADPEADYPYLTSGAKYTGKAGLYLYNSSSTTSTTAVYAPAFDMDDMSKMLITFWGKASYAASTKYVDSLYIGVGSNPADTADVITWLDTLSMPAAIFKQYRVLLDNWQPGMGNRVVFYNKHTGSNTLSLDDITFSSIINVTPYDLELLTASDNDASFTWTGEASQGWNVLVTKESIDPNATATIDTSVVVYNGVASTKPFTLTGLSAQTNYYVYVKPVEGGAEWSEGLNILTECLKLKPSRQFKMTFEGLLPTTASITTFAKSTFPDCWVRHGVDYVPFIYQVKEGTTTPNFYVHAGLAAAELRADANNYPAWFTSPELDAKNMANVTVKFWAHAGSSNHQMDFGVMVDPDDFTTYTKLADIKPGHTEWVQYTFLLEEYGYKPEMGNYITFAISQPGGWKYTIDDIEISESSCRPAKPILSKLSHNSVRLAYSAEPIDMRILMTKDTVFNADSLNKYDVQLVEELKAKGLICMDTIVEGKMGIPLEGLESNTNYSAALLTLCEEDITSWMTASWQTMCEPSALTDVAFIDFENYSASDKASPGTTYTLPVECWITGSKKSTATQTYIPYVLQGSVAPGTTGEKSLKFYSTKDYNGAYAIMPALDVDSLTKYELNFMGRAMTGSGTSEPSSINSIGTSAGSLIVGIITDPLDFSTFVAVDTVRLEDTDKHRCKVRFNNYTGDANDEYGKFVAFLSEFDANNYFYVDDISIKEIDMCGEPLRIKVDSLTDRQASISWDGVTEKYRVVITENELTEADWENYTDYVVNDTVLGTAYTFKGLKSNTLYFAYVKALCDGENGKWNLAGISFATDCAAFLELPYEDDFDRYASSSTRSVPSCWTTFNKGIMSPDATYPTVNASANYAGSTKGNGLSWSVAKADTAVVNRPTLVSLPIADVSKVMISFLLKTNSSTKTPSMLAIGYATNVSCADSLAATVTFVDTIAPGISSTAWVECFVNMMAAKRITAHLVFQQLYPSAGTSGTTLYMDDLKIEKTPSCFEPLGAEVLDVTYDEATIQITPFQEEDSAWDVLMVSKDKTDSVFATVDSTTAVVKGLKYSTYYTMYVRTNCGEGDVSAWSDKTVEFVTKFKIGDGWIYTFELSEGWTRTPLSTSDTYVAHPSLYIGDNMQTTNKDNTPYQIESTTSKKVARDGEAALQLYTTSSYYRSWVALPIILGEDSLQMRLDMRAAHTDKNGVITDATNYGSISRFQIGVIDEDYDMDSYQVLAEYKPSDFHWEENATEDNNLMFDQIVLPLPENLTGKRIVLMNPSRANKSYLYLDNLRLEKKQGWQTPVITTSTITPTTLTVDWNASSGNKWTVYLTQDTEHFPFANIPSGAIVAQQEVTAATATFTDLQPNTTYCVYVQVAGETDIAATSARRFFKTPADVKIATDSVISFEGTHTTSGSVDLYGLYPQSTTENDTLMAMSTNWYVGDMTSLTHVNTPWARLNGYSYTSLSTGSSYKNCVYAFQGERALHFYTYSTNDQLGTYAVMPEIDGNYDTLQVNFYARPFYENNTGKVGIGGTNYKGKPLVVGTMTDPNNPATFVAIDSLYYDDITLTTSDVVADLDNDGFQLFSFRLAGTTGKYVAFSAPETGHWFIDNIHFSEHTCITPRKLAVSDITKNSAVVTWRAIDGNDCIVQVSTSEDFAESTICFVDTVPANEALTIRNLQSVTTHYVRVCEMCAPGNTSSWTSTSFTTECFEVGPGYTCGFEESDKIVPVASSTSYQIPQCWMVGTTYSTTSSLQTYVPIIQTSSGTSYYARNTMETVEQTASGLVLKSTGSLKMYATKSPSYEGGVNSRDQWIVMPHLDLEAMDTDTMQLEFYALAGKYNPNTGLITTSYTFDSNLPSIVVGVMTDPTDLSTFTALDTCTYDMLHLTTAVEVNPENEYMFQHFVVPLQDLKGKGEYLAFKTYLLDWVASLPTAPTSAMSTYMYIDDVSMQRLNECYVPENMETSEISATSAKLTWTGDEGASWIVNVSADPSFEDIVEAVVINDTVTEMTFTVDGLKAMTTYYWTVQQICDAQSKSEISDFAIFKTAYVPLFSENFIENKIPVDWMRDTTRATHVFDGAPLLGKGITNAWALDKTNQGIYGSHMYAPMNSGPSTSLAATAKKSWLITPAVQLDAEQEAWLTFYAALTRYGSSSEADKDGWDDQFMVVVSEDGGMTWKRENAVIWNNETSNDPTDSLYVYGKGDYVLNDLPVANDKSMPNYISLAKYKGKCVKVAFYSESMEINAYNLIHIADIRINYVDYKTYEGTSCEFEDIISEDGLFHISGDNVSAGTHEYKVADLASINDLRENRADKLVDTLHIFTAHFNAAPEVFIETTICEGEVAGAEWGFQDRSQSGIYRRKGVSAVTGCDSITTFQLTVIPRQRTDEVVQICKGTSYEFNGKFYNETGVYVDTLTSVVTGCDSITTLLLTVNPPLTYEYGAYTCTGSTYYFTEKYPALTASGKYVDTLQTAEGCDSIVTLNLTVSEMIDIQIYDTVCEGTSYLFEGKAYDKPGKYEFEYTSVVGCDSIVTLHLAWRDIDTIVVDTMIYDSELPYIYPNTDLTYPKGTQPGVYVDTLSLPSDDNECGYVLVHKLTITMSTAVGNISASDIVLQPSIIELGESVTISGLGSEPVMVHVYDMVGHCVAQQSMSGNSIEVNAFNNAGVYMVRVSNTSGEQFVGRVIVK